MIEPVSLILFPTNADYGLQVHRIIMNPINHVVVDGEQIHRHQNVI